MTKIVTLSLRRLGRALTESKERVRVAVAGELGKAVGEAVRRLVHALAAGHSSPDPPAPEPDDRRYSPAGWRDDDRDDRWGDHRDAWADDPPDEDERYRIAPPAPPPPSPPAVVGPAVLAGVAVARWWVRRTGRWLAAAGWGLAVGLLGTLGGPVGRAAVAVLAAAADLLAGPSAPSPLTEF